jgi:alpha-beta hydrolase superfamily lysophospholipase
MTTLYRTEAPGDWGVMQAPAGGTTGTATLTAPGRPDIFYRYWQVGAPQTLLWMHGLGAHSGWFIDVGNQVAAQGVNFYAMDHQGFGRSGGKRGYVDHWQTYLTDIDHMVDAIQRDAPNGQVFVLGHSMGGVFAIHYAAAHQQKLNGLILLNPWIGDTAKVPLGQVLTILLGGIRGSDKVVILPTSKATNDMTTNPEADRMLQSDPYWVANRTQGFYWQITQMRGQTLARAAQITIPTLVLQADQDLSVTIPGTQKAYARLASADKTYTSLPGYGHDSEFEVDHSLMDSTIATWIKAHGG